VSAAGRGHDPAPEAAKTPARPLPRPIAGVIYDFDGTLADSIAVVVAATNAVLEARGLAGLPAPEVVAGMVWPTAPRMGRHAGIADLALQRALAEEFYVHANRLGPGLARSYPGVPELVAAVRDRGLPQGVVSNNQGLLVRKVLAALGLARDIGCAFGEEDMPAPKPDPRGLLAVAAVLGLDPAHCVYVGDTVGDARTAANAGMAAIGVTWGIHPRAELAGAGFAALVDAPAELLALLNC
jgi:HAD superfamily hydrolase (TIGR01509 family)